MRFGRVHKGAKETVCRKLHEGAYRARKREYMRRKRTPEPYKPKEDTIVAIGYADRQREKTLAMVGKVKVTL